MEAKLNNKDGEGGSLKKKFKTLIYACLGADITDGREQFKKKFATDELSFEKEQ